MIRPLTENDLDALIKLRRAGFFHHLAPDDAEARAFIKSRLSFTTGYFTGETLGSAMTLYPFEMNWAGCSVPMAGLAGVMTAPEFRRQGHIRALLFDAFERLYEEGVAWSLEYPFDPAYYAQFGYQSVPNGLWLELPTRALLRGKPPAAQRLDKGELNKLEAIYEAFSTSFNFSLRRSGNPSRDWARLIRSAWETRERTVYLLEEAYCIFDFRYGQKKNILNVHDFAYSSPQGRAKLLQFLGSFDGQADNVSMHLPTNDPLVFDYARYITAANTVLQARIINAKAALEGGSSSIDSSFTLKLEDEVCAWNNASFRVHCEAGRVSAEVSTQTPDVTMPLQTLVLLLSGGLSATSVQTLGLAEGNGAALAALSSMAGGRISFMSQADYF